MKYQLELFDNRILSYSMMICMNALNSYNNHVQLHLSRQEGHICGGHFQSHVVLSSSTGSTATDDRRRNMAAATADAMVGAAAVPFGAGAAVAPLGAACAESVGGTEATAAVTCHDVSLAMHP